MLKVKGGREMVREIQLNIGGMTCVNCEHTIRKKICATDGISRAVVSYSSGTADIAYDDTTISQEQIVAIIEKLGYTVIRHGKKTASQPANVVPTLVIIVALFFLLQSYGILNKLVPGQLAGIGMGYGMLFLTGLFTSVHCIAMCGGINLSQSLFQSGQSRDIGSGKQYFMPGVAYNLGRVFSYTATGFVFGLAGMLAGGGASAGISAFLQGVLKILAGLVMVVMGINRLGLFPWLPRFSLRLPGFAAGKIRPQKGRAVYYPFMVGIANGFMPCGPLQTMWIVALATGNPLNGALSMFFFSLGTVPLMLGMGSVVAALGKRFTEKMLRIGAILIVVLGLSLISQGGSLSGLLLPERLFRLLVAGCFAGLILNMEVKNNMMKYMSYAASVLLITAACLLGNIQGGTEKVVVAAENGVKVVDGVQIVNSVLKPGSYPDITVQAGIPVRWVIDAPKGSINGCNNRMMIREYGFEYTFSPGENIIEFTPVQAGTVDYSCWMGMIHGKISITENKGGAQ